MGVALPSRLVRFWLASSPDAQGFLFRREEVLAYPGDSRQPPSQQFAPTVEKLLRTI